MKSHTHNLSALCLTLIALAALVSCSNHREISEHVQLILGSEPLTPSTTFELRFDVPVIDPANVSRPANPNPLLIEPPLRGQFVWLSRRSGVFTPDQPTALGTAYRFTLRHGLKDAEGRLLDAQLQRTLRTPEFSVQHAWIGYSSSNVPALPEIKLNFNADIHPDLAPGYLEFRDGSGRRIPAAVVHPMAEESFYLNQWNSGDVMPTWRSQFLPTPDAPSPTKSNARTNPVLNRLLVSPQRPLPVGKGWRLLIAAGFPSADRTVRLPSPHEIKLGDVIDFTVDGAGAHNAREDGKRIVVRFSKDLDVQTSNLLDWITVQPAPTNLVARRYPRSVELAGAFACGVKHRVTVRAGLPSGDGMPLAGTWTNSVQFTPVPPRLYFPGFSTEQLASGRRDFELVAVNVPAARIRAKRLDRDTLVHALRGYQSYFKRGEDRDWNEPCREVDFNVVPGRTIYSRAIETTNATDVSRRIPLHWDDILGRGAPGAVFLVAEQPAEPETRVKQGTQAIVQLTDLGLAWKSSAHETTVHVFSHRNGGPVAGAKVRLLTDDNELLADGATDGRGLITLPLTTNAVWLLAESGDDLHAARLRENSVYLYNYGVNYNWNQDARDNRDAFLFTDRPLYRPGETVHFKGIIRDRDEEALDIPAGDTAVLRVTDPKDEKILETNLVVSGLGSVEATVALPEGSRGAYALTLHFGERTFHHGVQVADFQPNAFSVALNTKPVYAAGEVPSVPLGASYFMGAPVTRAKVTWSLEATDAGFAPDGFENFQLTTGWLDYRLNRNRSAFTVHGEGVHTSKSNLVIPTPIAFNTAAPQPRAVHLRAEVTDLNQQTITRSVDFVAHSSEFYLGLGQFRSVLRAGEPLGIEVVAVGADGRPFPAPVQAQLNLFRVDHISVPIQGAGLVRRFRNEMVVTNVATAEVTTVEVRKSGGIWEASAGHAAPPVLIPDRPGQWLLEARARDAGGRDVVTVTEFYVVGSSENAWAYRNETQIDLVPDKADYMSGETATILAKAPFSGHALVTVERQRVLRSFLTELTGNAPSIQVPIEEGDAPNVFVSVLLLRGAAESPRQFKMPEHRLGYCELKVSNPRSRLHVSLVSDAGEYRPSQTVRVTAEITDGTGQPARETEVTLYAVDEGILDITGHETPDPHPHFFRPQALGVTCALTLPGLFPEDPGQHRFFNKGYLIGGGGRERVRRQFLPCAFWNAALVTDAAGRVSATFNAPDGLTRYRVMAVAHNARHQFGSGSTRFDVNKPLMIEPALPRFAHVTDKLVARAVVHNQTAGAGSIEVTLDLDGKAVPAGGSATPPPRTLKLDARAAAPVEFPVEFKEAGVSKWTWRARFLDTADAVRPIANTSGGETFTDAVESTIRVEYLSPMFREIHLAHTEAAETNLLTAANPQLLEGRGSVAVQVANSRLGELGEALRYLLHYPYGCVEQTSSSLLPWIVLRNAPALTPDLQQAPEDFDRAIRAGVQRLFAMQTESGGLSYWPGSKQPMFWGSAYGGFVLALARRDTRTVGSVKFEKLMNYLGAELRGSSGADGEAIDTSAACLALYALALGGKPEPAYHELFFNKRERLSADNRALLALAITESGGPAAMTAELLSAKATSPRNATDWFGCDSRDLALQLLAWTRHNPNEQVIDRLVTELTHGRQHGHWHTTQGNAWAVLALKEYAARVEGTIRAAGGRLAWTSQVREFQLPDKPGTFTALFPFAHETAPLTLLNPERRRLYTQVSVEARPTVASQPRQDRGFGIARRYQRLDDEGGLHEAGTLHVGDRVLVSLTLDLHQPAHFLAVDDALPAVLEPLNPEFKSQQTSSIGAGGLPGQSWYSDHREFRADRALFFRDHVEAPGRYEIRYLTRVRAAGTVTAPCAKVEEMYHPERFGLSETIRLTALPLE